MQTTLQAIPTLYFQGVSDDALRFYHHALGAEILFQYRVADIVEPQLVKPGTGGRMLRAGLRIGDTTLYLADGHRQDTPAIAGFSVTLGVATVAEATRMLAALSDGGTIQMPMCETAWAAAFGTVQDRFGVHWTIEAGLKHPVGLYRAAQHEAAVVNTPTR